MGLKGISAVLGFIIALGAVGTLIYKLDSYNIKVVGDTVFATDMEMAQDKTNLADVKKTHDSKIAAVQAEFIYYRLGQEYRQNQQWLWDVERKFPDISKMSPSLRDQYYKIKSRQDELRRQMEKLEGKK